MPSAGGPPVRTGAHTSEGGICESVVEVRLSVVCPQLLVLFALNYCSPLTPVLQGYGSTFREVSVPLVKNPGAVAVACGRRYGVMVQYCAARV